VLPASAAKRLTVAQLEQALSGYSGGHKSDQDIARQIGGMELTERLTDLTLVLLKTKMKPGPKVELALQLLADQSAFLMPPASELPTTAVPNDASQQIMLDAARRYVSNLLPRLPNFVAVRTTKRYDDSPQTLDAGGWATRAGLHIVDMKSRETSVLEELDSGAPNKASAFWQAQMGMISGGEFGSTLVMIMTDTLKGKVAWSHWEQAGAGQLAVFNYSVPRPASHYLVIGSVYREVINPNIVDTPRGGSKGAINSGTDPSANPANTAVVRSTPGYHGSFWIDPSTGTVFRVTIESDSKDSEPFRRAAIMVEYGPVQIGEAKFICPTRSLAQTLGSYSGQAINSDAPTEWLNETLFTGYRRFASTTHIVTNSGGSPGASETIDREVQQGALRTDVPQKVPVKPEETAPVAGVPARTLAQSTPALSSTDVNSPATPTVSVAAPPTAAASTAESSTSSATAPAVPSATAPTAQSSNEPQPIEHAIQIEVNRVLIPVVVRDKNGLFAASLKKEDFQVFDDGKPRPLSGFSVERRVASAGTGGSRDRVNELSSMPDSATPPSTKPNRFVVLMFDDMHLTVEDLAAAKKAGTRLLAGTLLDSDMAAVVAISGKPNSGLTTDRTKLQDAIMGLQPRTLYRTGNADCPSLDYYQADLIENKHDSGALQDAVFQILACAPTLPQIAETQAHLAARRVLTASEQDIQVTFSSIAEFVRRMAALPGQRVLILISPGFLTIAPASLAAESHVIDLAAQSNVTISALDARGVYTTEATASDDTRGRDPGEMGELRREGMALASGPLLELSDGTGGTLVQNTNDLDAGLKRLAAPAECTYVLELSLVNMKLDGSYHRLGVKVALDGAQVQARRGYFMPKVKKK